MKVTFDNTWQQIVTPERRKKDRNYTAFVSIHNAIREGKIKPYLSETLITVESIPKAIRYKFHSERVRDFIQFDERASDEPGVIGVRAQIGGETTAHPGLHKILEDYLKKASSLGFEIIPSSRMGAARPLDYEKLGLNQKPLSEEAQKDIWTFLDRIAAITHEIEHQGYGHQQLEDMARKIQSRLPYEPRAWHDSLSSADEIEQQEIASAFAEWADADTVALHIAYENDYLCTLDQGKGHKNSIFSPQGRDWCRNKYGVYFLDPRELADTIEEGGFQN